MLETVAVRVFEVCWRLKGEQCDSSELFPQLVPCDQAGRRSKGA